MPQRKRTWALLFVFLSFLTLLVSCSPTKLTLTRANLKPKGVTAFPALINATTTRTEWETSLARDLRDKLQANVYGYLPQSGTAEITNKNSISADAFNGTAVVEEYTLTATATFGAESVETRPFNMVLVTPSDAEGPVPVILMQTFCPNTATVPVAGISPPLVGGMNCDGDGMMDGVFSYIFGRYIATPPLEMILSHGYALATIYPSEYVPDSGQAGLSALEALSKGHIEDQTRWGAIAAWGWGFSRMIDVLENDPRFDGNFVSYGHSRYGKAALVGAAFDDRITAVISHQSGTGGASLSRKKRGETVEEITEGYPHWFSNAYAERDWNAETVPVDQHALLALIAPRPIFLGNARRDVWSDPNGAFRAAIEASKVYNLYDKQGLVGDNLKSFTPGADISFYLRPGTHGVVKEDWPAFLEFLDAHTK